MSRETRAEAPIVVAARRTPIDTVGRGLATVDVATLAGAAVTASVADATRALGGPAQISDVVLGNCMGPGGNPARVAALAAGLGEQVTGVTVDRQCGSGLAAVIDAVRGVRDDGEARVAGGAESASTAPQRVIDGVAYSRAPFAPKGFPDPDMVRAAQDLAVHDGLSRERQDAHALRSHRRAAAAVAAGRVVDELVPIAGVSADRTVPSIERLLPRLPPLFPDGTLTAGTSTRVSDGAAAVVVAPARVGVAGLAVRGYAVVGCEPALPGIGAAPAVLAALDRADVAIEQVAAFEIVEAFSAQSLAVLGRLGIEDDDPRVCADGGALALGHPWGASGAVALVRIFSRLVRGGAPAGTIGVAGASVGGGLGVALVAEVVR